MKQWLLYIDMENYIHLDDCCYYLSFLSNRLSYFRIIFSFSWFTDELGTLNILYLSSGSLSLNIELYIDMLEKLWVKPPNFWGFAISEFILFIYFCYELSIEWLPSNELLDRFKASATSFTGKLKAAKYYFLDSSCFVCTWFIFSSNWTYCSLSSLSRSFFSIIVFSTYSFDFVWS